MARYRILVDIIEAGAARVPWLTGSSATGSKRISKRSWVAKAVLDVVQFRDEVERAEIAERGGPISVDIEGENGRGGLEAASRGEDEAALDTLIAKVELNMTNSTGCVSRVPKAARATTGPMRRHKKPRTTTSQAACFLLDPLAHFAPARTTLAHTAYLLSSDAATESSVQPTRLQLLAVERGNAEAVHDHELFSDGELEGIVISTDEQTVEEREKRAHTLRMMWGKDDTEATRASPVVEIGGKDVKKKGKDRMDMNKLNALLGSDEPFAALGIEEWDTSDEDTGLISREDEEVGSEW
jgi:transcription factor IIIB subunit 2